MTCIYRTENVLCLLSDDGEKQTMPCLYPHISETQCHIVNESVLSIPTLSRELKLKVVNPGGFLMIALDE